MLPSASLRTCLYSKLDLSRAGTEATTEERTMPDLIVGPMLQVLLKSLLVASMNLLSP